MHVMDSGATPPLIEEAAKKAAIAWLTVPGGGASYPVWCLWVDGALYVVSGPGEQSAPGLAEATDAAGGSPDTREVKVTLRGDHGGRIVTWPARAERLTPGDAGRWTAVAPQLAAKRLNAPGNTADTVARWAAECVVTALVPTGTLDEAGSTLPEGSLATTPRPTTATRRPRRPFRLHRVRGSKR